MNNDRIRKTVSPEQFRAELNFNPREVAKFKQQTGRLAFRQEGDFWNCYYALPNTMKGAIFISSTRVGNIKNEYLRQLFMKYNEECIKNALGEMHFTGEQPARK